MKIQKGDTVMVMKGSDRKKTGVVLRVMRQDGKALVQGINIRTVHIKPQSKDEKGRIEKREGVIDLSNIAVVDKKGKPIRVAYTGQGKNKARVDRRSGEKVPLPQGRSESKKKDKKA